MFDADGRVCGGPSIPRFSVRPALVALGMRRWAPHPKQPPGQSILGRVCAGETRDGERRCGVPALLELCRSCEPFSGEAHPPLLAMGPGPAQRPSRSGFDEHHHLYRPQEADPCC
jgi:hypothetical protein